MSKQDNIPLDDILDAKKALTQSYNSTEGRGKRWIKLYLDAIDAASKLGLCSITTQVPEPTCWPEVHEKLTSLGFFFHRSEDSNVVVIRWRK